MLYKDLYSKLKEVVDQNKSKVEFENYQISRLSFCSNSAYVLPGEEIRYCRIHDKYFKVSDQENNLMDDCNHDVNVKDDRVEENKSFNFYLLKPRGTYKLKKMVFLFHGFNEKSWDKYLPWGAAIADRLKCGVVFFPLAFHMDRAPSLWSEKRKMYELSNKRKQQFPNVIHSTLSNAAISARMQSLPQRFICSGLQTYYDIIQLIEELKSGRISNIDPDFSFDIFAYSIGGLLGEILKLTNYNGYFDNARLCLFCSGPVFNRLSPVSKYILDSEANVALYSYLVEHFDKFLIKDAYLNHCLNGDHNEGKVFRSMLEFKRLREYRESLFKEHEEQIYAIALKKDVVIPAFEVINTLNGAYRDIQIKVDVMDFDYPYTHETPFPNNHKIAEKVSRSFNEVFDKVCGFLSQ
ncbi:DUF6051 family protein [Saccharicrinis sp. 156]|uniref:DUF6051 family protein n=1 Tax=Saccharicrinis sp. 156 TaxID=3417574 RepID=UPI003D32D76E